MTKEVQVLRCLEGICYLAAEGPLFLCARCSV